MGTVKRRRGKEDPTVYQLSTRWLWRVLGWPLIASGLAFIVVGLAVATEPVSEDSIATVVLSLPLGCYLMWLGWGPPKTGIKVTFQEVQITGMRRIKLGYEEIEDVYVQTLVPLVSERLVVVARGKTYEVNASRLFGRIGPDLDKAALRISPWWRA